MVRPSGSIGMGSFAGITTAIGMLAGFRLNASYGRYEECRINRSIIAQQEQHDDIVIRSKHPKWKLWEEMNDEQQKQAIEEVGPYLTKLKLTRMKRSYHRHPCNMTKFGSGGEHAVCGPRPPQPCFFLSAGIRDDPTFDIDLASTWGCRGVAVDPSIDHPSHLHPLVTFHNIALNVIGGSKNEMLDAVRNEISDWLYASVPSLMKTLGQDYVDVVKLDCEGCEIAFTRDILIEDPQFLHRVGQISLETHTSRIWIDTLEKLYYFALNFVLLEEAGFKLVWADVFGCGKPHEKPGCMDEIYKFKYPCGPRLKDKHNPYLGLSCQDYLFIREDRRGT